MPAGRISPGGLASSGQLLEWEGMVKKNGLQGALIGLAGHSTSPGFENFPQPQPRIGRTSSCSFLRSPLKGRLPGRHPYTHGQV